MQHGINVNGSRLLIHRHLPLSLAGILVELRGEAIAVLLALMSKGTLLLKIH